MGRGMVTARRLGVCSWTFGDRPLADIAGRLHALGYVGRVQPLATMAEERAWLENDLRESRHWFKSKHHAPGE